MKVILVDCNYVGPEFAGCYLLVQEIRGEKRGFFIECNTNLAADLLWKAAQAAGLSRDQVDGIILTHIHLDHAGGAGLFLSEYPLAKAYAHPRAVKHLVNPTKLIASATQVYGEAFILKMYGVIRPCPAERVITLEDGDTVEWAGITLKTKHTRGHANHHLCVIAPETNDASGAVESVSTLFSGDSFGVSYPVVTRKRGLVMTVSTTPTDFDGEAALQTVEWIESENKKQPLQVALTHFGYIESLHVPQAALMLKDQIRFSMDMVAKIKREALAGNVMSESQIAEHIHDWSIQYYANRGIHFDSEDLKVLKFDFSVNAQGLRFVALKP